MCSLMISGLFKASEKHLFFVIFFLFLVFMAESVHLLCADRRSELNNWACKLDV